jgi:hypothetical protein
MVGISSAAVMPSVVSKENTDWPKPSTFQVANFPPVSGPVPSTDTSRRETLPWLLGV